MGDALRTILAAFAILSAPAFAGTLEVAPTTVVLGQDTKTGVLYVNNDGNAPVTVQIEPFDWVQSGGADRLTPSESLMASPPIAAIPAQSKQTVRLMTAPASGAGERSFRLVVSELPDLSRRADRSIQVLTQFSLPVFIGGAASGRSSVSWDTVLGSGGLALAVRNDGSHHAKLSGLRIVEPGGESQTLPGNGLVYILAGSTRSWKIPCARCKVGDTLRIEGTDDVTGEHFDRSISIPN